MLLLYKKLKYCYFIPSLPPQPKQIPANLPPHLQTLHTSHSKLPNSLHTHPNATAPSVTSSDWGYSSKNLILSRISTMFEGFILVFAKITNFPRSYHCSLKFLEVFEGFFRTEEELILSVTPHRGIDNRVPP